MPLAADLEAAVSERYDAVVIGGGPGGSSAALLLARAGWSVLLLERKPFPRRKVCGEYLSATNLPLFRHLGLADAFLDAAGPDVCRVGLFAGETILSCRAGAAALPLTLPSPPSGGEGRVRGQSAGAELWAARRSTGCCWIRRPAPASMFVSRGRRRT